MSTPEQPNDYFVPKPPNLTPLSLCSVLELVHELDRRCEGLMLVGICPDEGRDFIMWTEGTIVTKLGLLEVLKIEMTNVTIKRAPSNLEEDHG